MHSRRIALAAVLPMFALAACDDIEGVTTTMTENNGGTSNQTAQVRFVNATANNLSFAQNGSVGAGMSNLGFGASTSCTTVNASNPNLSVLSSGTALPGLTANLTNFGTYTIVAYPGTAGTTQFAVLPTTYTAGTNQSGLRVFNATGTAFDIYTAGSSGGFTTPSATNISGGTSSNFFSVASGTGGQIRLNNAGTTTTALTLTNTSFQAGQNAILVVAPPATGTTAYRTFLVTGC